MPPRFPIHEMQWRNERHTCSQSCIPSAFSKCQVHGYIYAMHLIDQFSSKFLLLYYNPPIDMISGFNTWNPEVQSPPTTRIQVPPAFVISFKSTFIQFECWRLLYDKFFFILRIRRIERQTEHGSFKTCVEYVIITTQSIHVYN
jgi:hypothetical protein